MTHQAGSGEVIKMSIVGDRSTTDERETLADLLEDRQLKRRRRVQADENEPLTQLRSLRKKSSMKPI